MPLASRLIIATLLLSFTLTSMSQDWTPPEKGILDIRGISFNEGTHLKLNGEWEFYWEQLLEPSDFKFTNPPKPTLYAHVPSYWTDHEHPDIDFGGTGYASYRLVILLPVKRPSQIAFDVPVFDVSFRMFLNGKLVHSNGITGRSKEESKPGYSPNSVVFTPESDSIEILLNISNFQHRRGGFWKPMQMGHPIKISRTEQKYELVSYISLGVLLAFSLFFLFFFLMYREDFLLLSFSLVVAGIFVRMMSTGLYPILLFFDIPWEWLIRFEYLGTFLAFGFAGWYFYLLLPARYMLWPTRVNAILISIAAIIILLFDVRVFAYTMLYFQPAVLFFMAFYFFTCLWSVIKGKTENILILVGLVVFIAGLVNDIFVANSKSAISNDYSIHYALQLFVFLQAIMIIRSWIQAYREKGRLMREIEDINVNLEKRVDDRTEELNTRNVEIESRNKELSEALDFKNRVFSIIAHDLKSPVASLVQNSALLDFDLSSEEQDNLIKSFREQSRSALNLIDNLLYWGRSQGSQLSVHRELLDMKDIVKEVLEPFVEIARHKSIIIEDRYIGKTEAFVDKELIEIVIRNLVSNAIKFTENGGNIEVYAGLEAHSEQLDVRIKDSGVGMSDEQIDAVLGDRDMISTPGTDNERGTGLGLRLCLDLIKANGGELVINSGKGTEVRLRLPVSEKQRSG